MTTYIQAALLEPEVKKVLEAIRIEALAGGALLTATVTLTNAQVRALPTTPVEVVAAPGAGMLILPFSAVAVLNSAAGAYADVDVTPVLLLQYVNTDQIASAYGNAFPWSNALDNQDMNIVTAAQNGPNDNNAIQITFGGQAGNLTGGDPANTLKVTVYYVVVTL